MNTNTLKPSDFLSFPMGSILQKSEAETIARNLMVIRARRGDQWPITWEEYQSERQKDGAFHIIEKAYFNEVLPLISDPVGAISFCPRWAQAARDALATRTSTPSLHHPNP